MTRCPRCGEAAPDGARFCPACGQVLATVAPPADRERRRITAVFVDLVGSTRAADGSDPEDVGDVLEVYYATVERELARHGGTLEKYIGDAVVAVFGVPVAHEDEEVRAVTAAVAARDAVRGLEAGEAALELHVRVGVATGEALVTVGSLAERGENLAAGDIMNTAARLQSKAPTDGVVVDAETATAIRAAFAVETLGALELKGKDAAVEAFVVAAPVRGERRVPTEVGLVGRGRELAELEGVLAAAAEGCGHVVTVVGEPGIGKSRLLEELEARSAARWIHGTCLAYGEGITYWPLARAFAEAAENDARHASRNELDAVSSLIERLTVDLPSTERGPMLTAISNVFGSRLDGGGADPDPITRGELHWGIRRALDELARDGLLVLVVHDVHWADESLVELLGSVAESDAPIAVLMTARPEGAPELAGPRRPRLILGALDARDAELLIERLSGGALDADGRRALAERAAGNPLFAHELVRAARDGDELAHVGDVPRTLNSVIGARLDQLPRELRAVAGVAAVVGTVFWEGAVGALGEREQGRDLEALVAAEVVQPAARSTLAGEQEFAFVHGLVRDVAYARLPKGRRAALHLRCAQWLMERRDDADDLAELAAAHLEQACLLGASLARRPFALPISEAVAALSHAADRAERHEGFAEAERFIARAIELERLDGADGSRPLRLRRARLRIGLGHFEETLATLEAIGAHAQAEDDDRGVAAAAVLRANVLLKLGAYGLARDDAELAREIARRIGDAELEARAGYELAMIHDVYDRDLGRAIDVLGEALVAADKVETPSLAVEGRLRMGFLLFDSGDLLGSEAVLRRVIASAEALRYRRDAARGQFELAIVRSHLADDGEPELLAAAAHEIAERADDAYFLPQIGRFRAELALERGDSEAAESLARAAFAAAKPISGWCLVDAGLVLVRTLVEIGSIDEAQTVLEGMRAALPAEDEHALAALHAGDGTVLAAHGDSDAAWHAFTESIRVADRLDNPVSSALARWQVVRVLSLGDPRVSALLDEAVEIWTKLGASKMLAAASALRAVRGG
jgi:class 3 adenylate cyclase